MLPLIGLFSASSFAAEPVFVPDFTPGAPDDWAVVTMVQQQVTDQLVRDGHIVLSGEIAARVVGPEAVTGCGPSPTCPQQVLPKLPTRVAVVVAVDRLGGTLVGHLELWEVSLPDPVDVRDVPIVPGNEHLFAAEVSRATRDLLARIGPSPDPVLLAAARLIAGQPPSGAPAPVAAVVPPPAPGAAPPGPVPVSPTPVAPVPVAPAPVAPPAPLVDLDGGPTPAPAPTVPKTRIKRYDGSKPHDEPIPTILEGTGVQRRHLVGSEANFMKSGLDPRDWMYRQMPHAGRLVWEIRSGLGMGDVDRDALIRVETRNGQQSNGFYTEGPSPARRVRGDMFVGYAPATMVDLGVVAGLQYGGRDLTTGVYTADADGNLIDTQISDEVELQAVAFYVQPRVRAYIVPLGPVKPFLFAGGEFKILDGYQIDQPPDVTYPVPAGGVIPGVVGGGGMMIDPGPIVGVFAEFDATRHFGELSRVRTENQGAPWPYEYQPLEATQAITLAVMGGIQFRL